MIGQECIDPLGKLTPLISQVNQLGSITCNTCGSINKSPIKLDATEIKFDTGDLFTNKKNHRGKTPLGEFKVTTPKNPLLSKQAVISN